MSLYKITDLCSDNLFIIGKFPKYSHSRYYKIMNILFKFGYAITLAMKKRKRVSLNKNLIEMKSLLYSYVNNTYKKGHIHHDLLKYVIDTKYKIDNIERQYIESYILKNMIVLNHFIKNNTFMKFSIESVDYFITKTITVYSIYMALKSTN